MFKFATNKFSSHNHGSSNNTASSNQTSAPGSQTASSTHHHQPISLKSLLDDNSQASRRRQIQKDLFAFNKIADKGFPSKPSAMDYDKKLKLLALGTKNGDIRIYGAPGTNQQQLSCYQDVHPFPILRLLFIQGQYQLITLSERVYRNDSTNKAESQLYLVLWQIPNNIGYELNNVASNLVEKIKEYQLDPKIVNGTRLSAITLLNDNSHLFLGFETGDVYVFNVSTFQIVPGVINKDYILKNLPDPQTQSSSSTPGLKKLTQLGAVESICHHPRQLTKLLIAYQRGLWVVFDFIKNQIDQINQTPQQLESAVFYQAGECVATSHSDGSFILWDLETTTQLNYSGSAPAVAPCAASSSAPNIVYGPYPCKAVTKCLVKTCRNDQPFVIFSGGCPRVNYSDKINISVIQGENAHVCFDFTSKIIDFFTIDKPIVEKQPVNSNNTGTSTTPLQTTTVSYDNPQALFVLLEEEFVAIDLVSEGWPQFKLPYLYSVHSSAIICTHYVNGVSKQFYDKLKCFGSQSQDASELYSEREWPISSSTTGSPTAKQTSSGAERKDILLTGHEDGSVRFWDVTQMSMTLLYKLKTGDYFQTDSTPIDEANPDGNENDSDNWPPFRKVGTFDPYSDDPKLGIQKIFLCAQREILVVAGTAGQVLIMSINEQAKELPFNQLTSHKINIIGVSPEVESHFVWKGHEPLALRGHLANSSLASSSNNNSSTLLSGSLKLSPGYQLHSLIQLYPPATVSALALNTDWQLVGMGTSHGFALFDYFHVKDLLIRCTLDPAMLLATNPNDSGNTGTTISRRKSLKKSLRESFRKLRRGRSQKPNPNKAKAEPSKPNQMRVEHIDDNEMDGPHKPIERQVESREFKPMDDIPPSVIRYMYFVRTFITSNQQQTNSLWVGTNTGVIYIYALQFLLNSAHAQLVSVQAGPKTAMSSSTIRSNQSINCLLAKEMRLKHRAPVVHIQVIDQNMQPLPIESGSTSVETTETSLAQQNHKVIICSEEQFKVFQLPTLKPVCKFKLTAVEGARVRRIGYNCYTSKNDAKYSEYCLSCLSNLGDLSVYSLPQLKRQVQIQCMKQQDINAITSFVFSKQGQAFYLQSPSEFVHISMSARDSPQQLSIVSAQKGSQKQQTSGGAEAAKPKTTSNKNPTQPGASSSSAAKPQAESGSQSTVNNNNNTGNQAQLQSPMTPPPPVPAPRTTLASSANESGSNRTKSSESKPSTTVAVAPVATTTATPKPAPDAKTVSEIDTKSAQHCDDVKNETVIPTTSTNGCPEEETEVASEPANLASPKKDCNKQIQQPTSPVSMNGVNQSISDANTSIITSNGALSSTSLNQSSISNVQNSTNITSSITNTNLINNNNNLINASITTSQSDSFNVSSSGYNGSSIIGGVTCSNFGIDLSMDSVVDRFQDDFNDVSAKKIPTAIDEDSSQATNQNDSLFNESVVSADLNKLSLTNGVNGHTNGTEAKTNGHGSRNGQINHTFEQDSCKTAYTNGTTNGIKHSSTPNSKTMNGTNGHHHNTINDEEDINMIPQKASSPLIKQNGGATNGHTNGHRSNKIEQVTKQIENGSKLEYRETAID